MFSRNVTKRKDQPSTLFSIATKPMAELSPDQVLHREVVLRTRATDYNLFSSVLSQLPADISSNDFESLIDECNEVLVGKNDSLNQIRTVYPPQFPNYSNLILTKNYHSQFNRTEPLSSPSHNQDEQIFMQLLKNAYSNDLDMNSSQQGLMRCNIILKDISEIHSFEFEKELDYWKFIACIHQGIDGEFVSYKGRCKYITGRKSGSRDAVKDKEKEKKKFSITMSTFTGIGSNSINNSFNDSFELRENGVFCRLSSSNSPTRSDETVILFRDIIALALNLDHRLPLDYVMHVSVRLPAGYFRVVKSELKSLELQFATTNIADKRTIHAAEQFGNGTLPFETIDTHNTLIPLTEDILGMKPETDFSSPSTAFFASPSQQNKDISPLVRSSSQVKGIWEFEVYSDRINGKLLGKKTVQQNPFLETVNPKTFDADMRKVLLNMNNANPQMIASSISGTDSYNNAETSPFGQFSSFGRSRGKSMRVSSPPPLNKKDSECESPKPSPKRTTSINFSSGMNAATTINPNASYSGVVKSFLKCNDIKRYDLDIVQKQFHKALRVFIRSASGLAGGGGKKATPPSAYCTVYLVGKNQERLTANHTDVRTDTIKSVDPEWNKEILLQDQNLGIDEVQGVMVLVRDAASGFLKHKHLGQVMVPIDCFLPQDEAAFCLPLEPSYRMDGMLAEQSFLGNINLTTQLVNVESVDSTMNLDDIYHNAANEDMAGTTKRDEKRRPSTSGAPASTKQRQLFVRTKSVELVNAQLMCSLHRSSPSSTWWPIKILQISCMNKYQSTPSVNYHGFVLLNPHGVVLKVNFLTSESVVATAETQSLSLVADLLRKSKEYFDPHIILPYLQVESATVLSSSCLFLTLQLHNSNNNTTASRFTLEILCGPCKAQELSLFFSIRRRSVEVYHELTSLESKAPSLHPLPLPSRADSKRFTKSGFALPQSPSKQTDGGFAFFPDNLTSGEWVTSVKSIIRNLEAQHVQLATNESNANKAMERVYVRILFHLLRLFYIPNLLNVSSDITAAHYSNDSIRMRIHGLLDQATAEVKTLQSNGKDLDENEFLIARLSIFLDKTLVDFYQSLIFLTPRLFMNPPSSSFQENFFPEQIKPFLETFLTVVHLKFQDNLKDIASFLSLPINSYTSDLAVLKKRRWMKFLVEKNDYLQERFLTLLTLFHPSIYSIDPTFLLLPTQTILDFIHQMYQDHLKGLQSLIAALFREGSSVATSGQGKGVKSNYRWTVSLNSDGFQVSLIPENAQKILKMLVDYYDSLKQTPIIYSFVPSPAITSSSPYLKLCKKLLLMIYNAWLFVGHEYYSATHSHYLNLSLLMKKNIKPDYVVDLSLFVANLNDCSRIMSDYFPVLRDMTHKLLVAAPTSTLSASLENDIMKSLQEESYDIILEQLLLIITRLIFMPVVQSFLHFDELYFKVSATTLTSSNPPPSRFITTVCEQILNYLTKVRGWFSDMSLYLALIYLCEETIINRYLLFIRDAVAQTSNGSSTPLHQFTREEVLQFQSDFDYMKSVFEMISVDLPPLKAGQEKGELLITWSMEWTVPPLQYFEHLVNLLVRSIESFEFNSSLRFLLSLTEEKSGNISTSGFNQVISTFLEYFLLHIILPLHTESNDGEESRYQKENLFTYLMNFLDGNYEVIYRRTNEFCPINIQPRNHHTNFSNSIQQPFFPFGEEFPSNLKRDLLWRMFSPHNMHNSSNSTKSSVINQPSSRGNHETLLSLPDSLQNPFKGLFSTSNPSSNKVQVPLSATNHSIVLGENRNGRNSGKFSSPALIGSATVDNVRQTASEWIQKMTFMPKKGDSTVSSKKEYREKAVYDENTLFDVIGLEVFYDETIVSMEEAKGKSAHVNENINDKASNSNPTSASSKNNQPASSSLQTPVRTTRQDSSGKTSLFHLFTGNTGTGGASSKHNNHQSSTTQKSKNPGISLMTENKEEPIYDTAVNRHTPHHAPPTPSVQQALHFFDDNETNTPATTVLSSNRGLKSLTLKISQVRLSGIHTSSIFSKANPYVYFLIPSLQVKVKTSLLHNASQGDFTDVMQISLPANSDVDNQTLTVEVYDKEKIRRKILLGWNSFRLAPYIVTEESQSVELPLVSPENKSSSASANGKEFGKISFSLQFIVS